MNADGTNNVEGFTRIAPANCAPIASGLQLTPTRQCHYYRLDFRTKNTWQGLSDKSLLGSPSVANFFLIDHSLRKPGGHHFDYTTCVARAANELGFLTTIGTNRLLKRTSLNDPQSIDRLGTVRRIFRETTYQPDSFLAGLQHLTRSDSFDLLNQREPNLCKRYWNSLKRFMHRRRREGFVRRFAVDCERFFRPLLQMPGDHAFLTTISELELMGLAVYLSNHPKTLQTHWHLQFHFNLFDGRTPEYDGQEHILRAIRSCCLAALSRISSHLTHFYTTSDTLVDQYNRLGLGEFELLPYPVSQEFSPATRSPTVKFREHDLANVIQESENSGGRGFEVKYEGGFGARGSASNPNASTSNPIGDLSEETQTVFRKPLRITCPGEVRREKGQVEYLQPLVDEIWPTHLSTGNVQIVVQRPPKKWHAKKDKIALKLPNLTERNFLSTQSPIEYFSHPLDHDDYVELINSTDCGLLFYDSRVYFSRRAGVLGELLACGKPVVVPAGSWLAEQIAEPIFRHVDDIVEHSRLWRSIDSQDFAWDSRNVPMPGGVLSFDQGIHPFDFSVERENNENAMVLEFDWHWPKESGVYCQIEMTQKDASGEVIATTRRVLGYRRSTQKVNSLFQLDIETCVVEFSLTNAFHNSTASIKQVKLRTLELSFESESGELPIGRVGVIAADQDDLPNCVDEIVKHYDHYRESALAFSERWYDQHDPRRTVNHLLSVGQSATPSIPRAA